MTDKTERACVTSQWAAAIDVLLPRICAGKI